jgi:hypothetical protein
VKVSDAIVPQSTHGGSDCFTVRALVAPFTTVLLNFDSGRAGQFSPSIYRLMPQQFLSPSVPQHLRTQLLEDSTPASGPTIDTLLNILFTAIGLYEHLPEVISILTSPSPVTSPVVSSPMLRASSPEVAAPMSPSHSPSPGESGAMTPLRSSSQLEDPIQSDDGLDAKTPPLRVLISRQL